MPSDDGRPDRPDNEARHRAEELLRASFDITELERVTAESRLLQDVMLRVADAKDIDAALASVMRLACDTTAWAYAEAWVPTADGAGLERSPVWHGTINELAAFRRDTNLIRITPDGGLIGRAWLSQQPVWMADVAADPQFLRREAAAAVGLRTGIALPIATDDGTSKVIAVLAFFALDRRENDPRLTRLLVAVMAQLGAAIQRKQAELALRSSRKLLESVVSSAPVIVFALDRDGVFTLSEGRGLEALGLRSGQLVGVSALDVYADAPDVAAHLKRALSGESFIGVADAAGRSYQTWYSASTNPAGAVTGVVGVATDITERRQLEEQLRHSQKLESVGQLAGGIAHDFNNMLTAISGYAELLMQDAAVRPEVVEIKHAAEKARLLTYQLLAFSRKQILRPETLNLNEAVTDVYRMLQRLIGEDITMVTRLGADLGAVSADPGQLAQVILNLSVNARDAMPDGGVLTLETANVDLDEEYASTHVGVTAGSFVVLAVGDTGIGMSPEVRRRIFEPFFTTKPVGKGTGMGLATVYGIVTQSEWHVEVQSEPGIGSTFKVYLPRVRRANVHARERGAEGAPPRGTETILLVEDEDMVRRLVRLALEGCGYTILEATDGATALEICGRADAPIALLITDVVMPKMSGRELVGQLAETRPDLRVLFMSGYTDDAIVRHGVLDEATHFLQKPFTIRTLAQKVREVLDS